MRVISGLARGKNLLSPTNENIRPTSEKVKEAVFSSIQFDLPDAVVLDLFAGSGQLGIEALSRGAKFAYFTECDRGNFEIIKKNISACSFGDKSKIFNTDARLFVKKNEQKFDIIFLDPPYGFGLIPEILPYLPPLLKDGGKIVCEHEGLDFGNEVLDFSGLSSANSEQDLQENLKVFKEHKYGKVYITYLVK
ncbi:MAG: 16S rRNA (guanine(966)-N(2))-methyltransferase RsmD [Oscillospiraceae bacterium]|jgi:16S rRNA (guanine(966)-N(2))-methyltransferase RsmD|nr:16S rRNA (guanine(966)-N(2))-methyltransferase RsmD [Oscillospiraceae bacterium]